MAAPAFAVVLAITTLTVGCGGGEPESSTTPTSIAATSGATTEPPATLSSTPPSATAPSATSPTALPGQEIVSYADAGDVLAVMGVAYNDVLNVRALPGTNAAVVAELAPTADDAVATGRARLLPSSIWYEVTVGSVTGWARSSYLGLVAATDDATAEFLRGAAPPRAETMRGLGELVAKGFAPADPEPGLRIVQSTPASVADLGEISYDVIGIGDDSTAGYRLHVFATPDGGGEGFVLRSIERTTFCWRGSTGEVCV